MADSQKKKGKQTKDGSTEVTASSKKEETPKEEKNKEAPQEATDSSSKSKSPKVRSPAVDTSLHIIKGAAVKVLGTPLTCSVEFTSATKGKLCVQYDKEEKVSDDMLKEIEKLSNEKIKQNVPIQNLKFTRAEAEEKFKNRVNNTFIYDKFPVPDSIKDLTVVYIEDWNVNCCPGPHYELTGQVGTIKILRANARPQKKELDLIFEIIENTATPTTSISSPTVTSTPVTAEVTPKSSEKSLLNVDNVPAITEQLLRTLFTEIYAGLEGTDSTNLKKREGAICQNLQKHVAQTLNTVKNTAYTRGYTSALPTSPQIANRPIYLQVPGTSLSNIFQNSK